MKSLVILALTLMAGAAQAGQCLISTTRYACPGKEKDSYSKCAGQQSCDAETATATVQECAALTLRACINTRLDITKYKMVRAKFNGANVSSGIDFCDKDQPGYKVSKNFPYRNSANCR